MSNLPTYSIDGYEATRIACSQCGSNDSNTLFTRYEYQYQQCNKCGLIRVNPQLTQQAIANLYGQAYENKSLSKSKSGLHIPNEHRLLLQNLASIAGGPGELLDIGCFEGHFLYAARESGWQVTGTEISETAVTFARETWQLDVRLGALEEVRFADNQFDAVVLGDVIEHLPDPRRTFEEINRILRPGGAVYVWTPNFNSITRHLFKQKWGAVIFPWHLYYFTPKTLIQLCASAGINCQMVTTYNWLFDFRDPYLAIPSQKPPQQRPLWLQRGLRLFDKVTAPILKQASKYNLFWGAQIAFYGKKDA